MKNIPCLNKGKKNFFCSEAANQINIQLSWMLMYGFPWYQKGIFGCIFSSYCYCWWLLSDERYDFCSMYNYMTFLRLIKRSKLSHEYPKLYFRKKANLIANVIAKVFLPFFVCLSLEPHFMAGENKVFQLLTSSLRFGAFGVFLASSLKDFLVLPLSTLNCQWIFCLLIQSGF